MTHNINIQNIYKQKAITFVSIDSKIRFLSHTMSTSILMTSQLIEIFFIRDFSLLYQWRQLMMKMKTINNSEEEEEIKLIIIYQYIYTEEYNYWIFRKSVHLLIDCHKLRDQKKLRKNPKYIWNWKFNNRLRHQFFCAEVCLSVIFLIWFHLRTNNFIPQILNQ